jgi:prevent-host-death family protein
MPDARVPVARLKARLSEYLSRVKAGERVLVTERGVPVASMQPVEAIEADEWRLSDLRRAGLIREPLRRLGPEFFSAPRPADREGRSLEAVLEERAEGH